MLINDQVKQLRALNQWFQTPLGLFVAHEFSQQLASLKPTLRGDCLVQLGLAGSNLWLNSCHYTHQWIISPFAASKIDLLSELKHLPLARHSVDAVVIPLTLELFPDYLNLMDEIDRVLKPTGQVVFFCFNPWSLWGAAIKTGLVNCYQTKQIKMYTPFYLNRLFISRGYHQVTLNHFCYLLPVKTQSQIKKFTFLEEIGKMLWPIPSGFYCYVAQKNQWIEPYSLKPSYVPDYESPLQVI